MTPSDGSLAEMARRLRKLVNDLDAALPLKSDWGASKVWTELGYLCADLERLVTAPHESAAAALYGFMGWLTSQPTPVGPFCDRSECASAADLVTAFCKAQGYADPFPDDWSKRLKPYPTVVATAPQPSSDTLVITGRREATASLMAAAIASDQRAEGREPEPENLRFSQIYIAPGVLEDCRNAERAAALPSREEPYPVEGLAAEEGSPLLPVPSWDAVERLLDEYRSAIEHRSDLDRLDSDEWQNRSLQCAAVRTAILAAIDARSSVQSAPVPSREEVERLLNQFEGLASAVDYAVRIVELAPVDASGLLNNTSKRRDETRAALLAAFDALRERSDAARGTGEWEVRPSVRAGDTIKCRDGRIETVTEDCVGPVGVPFGYALVKRLPTDA